MVNLLNDLRTILKNCQIPIRTKLLKIYHDHQFDKRINNFWPTNL